MRGQGGIERKLTGPVGGGLGGGILRLRSRSSRGRVWPI